MEQNVFSILNNISNSKLFNVVIILLLNIGGSQLLDDNDIRNAIEYFLSSKIMKLIVIFAICFSATNDILVSFICTLITGLLIYELLNKKSNLCILTNTCKRKIQHFSMNREEDKTNKHKEKLYKMINKL